MNKSRSSSWTRAAVGMLAVAAAHCACAGVFSVTPVRIYMTPKDRAVAVTITNEANEPVVLQADIYEWRQSAEGEDQLTPSEDLILAPPVVKLGAKAKQVVRLARLQPPDASRQLIYRLILRELPEAGPVERHQRAHRARALDAGVHHAAGGEARQLPARRCATKRGTLAVQCANSGSAYAQVREVVVRQDGQAVGRFEGGAYILPGARKRLPLEAATHPGRRAAARRHVRRRSTQTFDVPPI